MAVIEDQDILKRVGTLPTADRHFADHDGDIGDCGIAALRALLGCVFISSAAPQKIGNPNSKLLCAKDGWRDETRATYCSKL